MYVPTRNVFEHEGCIKEERDRRKKQEKETAATKEAEMQLERYGSRKIERKHKRQRQGIDRNKTTSPSTHRNFLSVQPSASMMTHDTLNTLGEVTIPRADKNVITLLLQ